ncbi:hypothetical protein D1007_13296 [Hordeum vulgare]|nr:hypothetical protein D1007_13296 [Hordeum vulgare]
MAATSTRSTSTSFATVASYHEPSMSPRMSQGGELSGPAGRRRGVVRKEFRSRVRAAGEPFFSSFLMNYGHEPHHLAPNIVLQLSAFVTLCEGFLGIETLLDLWHRLFFFKQPLVTDKGTDEKWMTPCGSALVYHCSRSDFP